MSDVGTAGHDVFDRVVGQARAVELLTAAARAPVHAYLFVGPTGSGKEEAARAFAALLVDPEGDADGRDARLALAGAHPDVREIERVGASILSEQAQEVIRIASLSPTEGARKVIILHEFHLLAPAAAAMLLKTIEEPPASTVFLVLADLVTPDLVTIASRCVKVEFAPLTGEVIEAALIADGVQPETAASAARSASGDLVRARLLATDTGLAGRRAAFGSVPEQLNGTGNKVVTLVAELMALIDGAAEPLKQRHEAEIAALDERIKAMGERGSGKKQLEDRQKREMRRHRVDELKAGLGVLSGAYRDRLVAGALKPDAAVAALADIHSVVESFERNPNEVLQLQALLLRLP